MDWNINQSIQIKQVKWLTLNSRIAWYSNWQLNDKMLELGSLLDWIITIFPYSVSTHGHMFFQDIHDNPETKERYCGTEQEDLKQKLQF